MPPRDGKRSSNCCTNRNPPSPEGEPPRPAIAPSKLHQPRVKDVVSSGSTGAAEVAAELRPIFEEGEIDNNIDSMKHGSSSKAIDIIRDENPDADDEWEQIKPRKSNATLNAVKQKLKKHLSREMSLVKRQSISSVGTTEEEIERRAELRRIRHKRIKEELSNEASYDEDAKSILSIADGDTTLATTFTTSWSQGDAIPLPHLLSPSLSYPSLPVPEPSPLDELSDRNDNCAAREDKGKLPKKLPNSNEKRTSASRSMSFVSRRHSSPLLTKAKGSLSTLELTPQRRNDSRKQSLLPPIPSAPTLPPVRLPSIGEPQTHRPSWRLSFVAGNRAEELRRPSQEEQIPNQMAALPLSKGQPVLSRWLHGQGLRYSSNGIASLDEGNAAMESLVSESKSGLVNGDIGDVDGGVERPAATVHLHQMDISHRLFSAGTLHLSCSSPQLASWGSHQRGESSFSNATDLIHKERRKFLRQTSDSANLSGEIPRSWGKVVQNKGSSFYSSSRNSPRPTPESSRFNLVNLLASSKIRATVQSRSEDDIYEKDGILIAATTSGDCFPQRVFKLSRQARSQTQDDSSFVVSETESFRQRESELRIVKARFASLESRRCPSTPVSSKFREEFDLEPSIPDSPILRRPSKFHRLAKFAIRQHDGPATNIEDMLGVPKPNFIPSETTRRPRAKSGTDEALGGSWGGTPLKKDRKPSRSNDEVKTVLGGLAFMGNRKKKKSNAAMERKDANNEEEHLKELVMDSWEQEMAAIAGKAKAKSKNIVKKKPTGPDLRYPPNWARFPSHNRHERSLSAGRPDKVQAKDFAMKTVGNGEPTWYIQERKYHLYHYEGDDHPSHAEDAKKKGIFNKVQKIVKEEIKYYETMKEPPEIEDTYGRRSSLNVPLETDYPELEILPMEVRRASQMEREVLEQLAEQKRLQDLADTDMGTVDGSVDSGRAEVIGGISIADPKFYEDCVVTTTRQLSVNNSSSKKGKHRTWSGRDWDTFRSLGSPSSSRYGSVRGRRRELSLRKSTEDYHLELRKMEGVEREKLLQFAKDVWGKKDSPKQDEKPTVVVTEAEVEDARAMEP